MIVDTGIVKRYDVFNGRWIVGYWKNSTQFYVMYFE